MFNLFKREVANTSPEFVTRDINALFQESLQRITNELKHWMTRDVQAAQAANVEPDNSLAFQLSNLNLSALPRLRAELEGALTDNDYSLSATRFFDCITYLRVTEPPAVFEIMEDRFLHAKVSVLPRELKISNGEVITSPSLEEWTDMLNDYPWIPLLCIIQHEYDNMLEELQD